MPPEQRSAPPQGLAAPAPLPIDDSKRLALLIGNEAYGTVGLATLNNPHEDVARVRDSLLAAGFPSENIVLLRDRNRAETIRAINDFSERLRVAGPEAVGFFYYSGHGGSAERGAKRENFIVPVREPIEYADDLESFGVSLVPQVDKLSSTGAGAVFVVIDACRNTLSWKNTMAGAVTKGVRREDFNPTGMMLLFSAGDGAFADDDPVFSTVLSEEVRKPGQSALEAFAAVSRRVGEAKGFGNRTPVVIPALTKELCFVSCALDLDERDYATAREINTVAAWDFYLRNHPQGRYVAEARLARARVTTTPGTGPGTTTAPAFTLTPPEVLFDSRRQPATVTAAVNPNPTTRLTDFSMFRECEDCPDMVVIPGGSFSMGSPASEAGRGESEDDTRGSGGAPLPVTIPRKFAVARFEVTRADYAAFVAATGRKTPNDRRCYQRQSGGWVNQPGADWQNPGFSQADDHPAVCLSWQDAIDYVNWTNARLGLYGREDRYRLLSEAEFEYALRAGNTTPSFWNTLENRNACAYANHYDLTANRLAPGISTDAICEDSNAFTAAVGRFRANPFGLYDMAGNVEEWVHDCGGEALDPVIATGKTRSSDTCASAMIRGGAWYSGQPLRSAAREWNSRDYRTHGLGFRIARTLAD